MSSQPECPPPDRLKALLDGRSPGLDRGGLAEHIEVCPACQRKLEMLAAEGESLAEMARHLGPEEAPQEPALQRVIAELQRPTEIPSMLRENELTGEDMRLDFLAPPDRPERLGMLAHYEILEVLGRGGMGVVLKAFDPTLTRHVAIKVLAPQLASSVVARRRFAREARAAAAVSHEHVVAIHAVDEVAGLPYLVMPLI